MARQRKQPVEVTCANCGQTFKTRHKLKDVASRFGVKPSDLHNYGVKVPEEHSRGKLALLPRG